MQTLEHIKFKIKNYLEKRSKKPDGDYYARQTHFDKLNDLLAKHDFDGVIKHINTGLTEFKKFSLSEQKYYGFLLELNEFFIPKSESDKAQRFEKLIAAVEKEDIKTIEEALNQGGLAVINESYLDKNSGKITTLLQIAIENNKKKALMTLLKSGAKLDAVSIYHSLAANKLLLDPVNPIIDANENYTLLHLASELGLIELAEIILAKGANPNVETKAGQTPLLLTCDNGHEELALELLDTKADPKKAIKISDNLITPLAMSVKNNQLRLAKALLSHGAEVDEVAYKLAEKKAKELPKEYRPIYYALKDKFRAKKEAVIAKSKATAKKYVPENTIDIIASQMHFENESQRYRVESEFNKWYNHKNQILRPLLDLIAVAMQGEHRATKNKKPLKAVIVDSENITTVTPIFESQTTGLYGGKRTVYGAGINSEMSFVPAVLLHELTHFAGLEIFGDINKTYFSQDENAFLKIREHLENFIKNKTSFKDEVDDFVSNLFNEVFDKSSYKEEDIDTEIIARVPEVLATVGIDEGVAWFKKNIPELLDFYENNFNQACLSHIKDLQEWRNQRDINPNAFFKPKSEQKAAPVIKSDTELKEKQPISSSPKQK